MGVAKKVKECEEGRGSLTLEIVSLSTLNEDIFLPWLLQIQMCLQESLRKDKWEETSVKKNEQQLCLCTASVARTGGKKRQAMAYFNFLHPPHMLSEPWGGQAEGKGEEQRERRGREGSLHSHYHPKWQLYSLLSLLFLAVLVLQDHPGAKQKNHYDHSYNKNTDLRERSMEGGGERRHM